MSRVVRAVWRDSRALLREFRRPLLTALLAVFVGGFVYGELLALAGKPRLPYIDLPYIMLSLMVLESPGEVPQEPYLVAFWYLLPMLGIYIIGRGAVDFVRLFFNRTERRDAWEIAVASTYRNHVILVGVGHVGMRITRRLAEMGFEVVAIDKEIDPELDAILKELGTPTVLGDARQNTVLDHAGLKYADSLIICTSSDHVNLEITMRARDLNPDMRIVARMWDDRFAEQLHRFMGVEVLSASDLAAPAFAGAAVGIEITQTLNIAGEDYSMIQLKVEDGSFMDGKSIDVLQEDEDIDIVLHGQQGQNPDVHPDGERIVHGGDTLVVFSRHRKITEVVSRNRRGINGE